jgi:hypothetical protein
MLFYSQQGEDLFILKNLINKKCPSGVFVEVGALDGIKYSNTGFLEQELCFSGVLIEPSEFFYRLEQSRHKCICVKKAISETRKTVLFKEDWARSGIVDTLPEECLYNQYHEEHLNKPFRIEDNVYELETSPLHEILGEHKIEYIDFMSIDTEGGELGVLQSMNWDIPTYVICIELDGKNEEKDNACREILIRNGFKLRQRLCVNEFYVNDAYFRKNELYDSTKPYVNWGVYKNIGQIGSFVDFEPSCFDEVQRVILG